MKNKIDEAKNIYLSDRNSWLNLKVVSKQPQAKQAYIVKIELIGASWTSSLDLTYHKLKNTVQMSFFCFNFLRRIHIHALWYNPVYDFILITFFICQTLLSDPK